MKVEKGIIMKNITRILACIPGLFFWLTASFFALKLLGHIAQGSITFGNSSTAVFLPILCVLVLAATAAGILFAAVTIYGKFRLRWQWASFTFAFLSFWLICGD